MKKAFVFCFALLTSMLSMATTVGMHLASVHERAGFNNTNLGGYVRFENGATVGAYRNSINQDTVYAGYTWRVGDGPFSVSAVALTGYQYPIVATLIPSLEVPIADHVHARVFLVVAPEKSSALSMALEVEQ